MAILPRRAQERGAMRRWSSSGAASRVPLLPFAMQMETDYSIRAYSRSPDNDTAIAEAVASFASAAPAERAAAGELTLSIRG